MATTACTPSSLPTAATMLAPWGSASAATTPTTSLGLCGDHSDHVALGDLGHVALDGLLCLGVGWLLVLSHRMLLCDAIDVTLYVRPGQARSMPLGRTLTEA